MATLTKAPAPEAQVHYDRAEALASALRKTNETFRQLTAPLTMKPRLLLDMDGPLADFDAAFWQMAQSHGWDMDIETLDSPGRQRFLSNNLTDSGDRADSRHLINTTPWFRYLPVVDGAQEGVEALSEVFDIWVCTKPLEANPRCRDDKAAWLKAYFPSLEKRLIIAPDKSVCSGAILLDDAIKLSWLPRADWNPVAFPTPFNGPGSQWADLPRWTWGDPVDALLDLAYG